jgi:hypothetical protein
MSKGESPTNAASSGVEPRRSSAVRTGSGCGLLVLRLLRRDDGVEIALERKDGKGQINRLPTLGVTMPS